MRQGGVKTAVQKPRNSYALITANVESINTYGESAVVDNVSAGNLS